MGNIAEVAILGVLDNFPSGLNDRRTPEAGLFRKRESRVLGLSGQSLVQTKRISPENHEPHTHFISLNSSETPCEAEKL